jgi:hypothetical protein
MSTQQQPITTSEIEGRKFVFQLWKSNPGLSKEAIQKEEQFYLNVPIKDEKPVEVLNLETARSQTAQLRELRKEQETVLANNEKIIQSAKEVENALSKLTLKSNENA